MCTCVCVCVCVCACSCTCMHVCVTFASVIVKHSGLPPFAGDGRNRNALYYHFPTGNLGQFHDKIKRQSKKRVNHVTQIINKFPNFKHLFYIPLPTTVTTGYATGKSNNGDRQVLTFLNQQGFHHGFSVSVGIGTRANQLGCQGTYCFRVHPPETQAQ